MSKKRKNPQRKRQQHRKKEQSNLPAILFFSISGVVIIAFLVFFALNSGPANQQLGNEEPLEYEFLYEGHPSVGDEEAPIKIVEFGDYKCSYCKDFHDVIYPELKKDFIDSGKVQFFFINYPFIDDDSYNLARAGKAVFAQDEKAFWDFQDAVFEQPQSEAIWATDKKIAELVADHLPTIDVEKFKQDFADNAQVKSVNQDISLAKEAGVTATPTMFINGKQFGEWYNYEAVKSEIERLLESEDNE